MSLINPKYKFPDYYSWPFFFTIQKDGETKRKQLTMWSDLTVKFCQDNKIWKLDKNIFFENLGKNPKINRKLNTNSIDTIFGAMVQSKRAKYVNEKDRNEIFILWKSIAEWEEFIYSAAVKRGTLDKLETLDYICEDDENKNEEYYQIDKQLLIIILKDLEKQKKCSLIGDNDEYVGVKFYK